MTDLWNMLPASGWERLAADAAWQSTAIAACALIAAWFVRRRAALRAAILFSAAALSLAVPLLSTAVRLGGGGMLAPPARGGNQTLIFGHVLPAGEPSAAGRPSIVESIRPGTAASETAASETAASEKVNRAAAPSAGRPWRWLVGCWLAASSYLAFRLLRGVFLVRRWIRLATPCHDGKIEAALSRAALAIGVRRPELLWSAGFDSPALVMLGPARLLLPAEMPEEVDWFAVFCHELAHCARRDGLSRLVVELAVIALPWQPLLWLVRREFRAACEEACDDWAVAAGADPVEFASLLVALVPERRPAFALGMAESPAATRHRILRLLAMQGSVHPRLGLLLGVVGWTAAIALAITVALLQSGSRPTAPDPLLDPVTGKLRPDLAPAPETGKTFREASSSRPVAPPWGNTPLAEAIAQATRALPKSEGRPAPYVIDVPDVLLIDSVKLVPKSPYHIEPLDVLQIRVGNPLIDQPISGDFPVGPDGAISLGPPYGKVVVAGQTIDEALKTIETHLSNILRDPTLSVSLAQTSGQQLVAGEHLVGPDGTVIMGTYGTVYVAGMTVAEAKAAVEAQLSNYLEKPQVSVDVYAYNSKVYYVIAATAGSGDTLARVPIKGNETVLDALAQQADGRIPDPANCWAWVARPMPGKDPPDLILPVDLQAVLNGDTRSNWRIQPGDRIFVRSKVKAN